MKELSTEEKAKRYDEVLTMAKECITYIPDDAVNKYMLKMFPELKESEDERIKNVLIGWINLEPSINFNDTFDGFSKEQILAWLEKHGESYTKMDVDDAYLEGVTAAKNEIEKQYEAKFQIRKDIATFIFNYKGDIKDRAKWMEYLGFNVSFVEKQGEQKSHGKSDLEGIKEEEIDGVNNAEPRFRVKFAGKEYDVLEVKGSADMTFYGIEDEPNHIDYVRAENCEIIGGCYAIKEDGSSYPTKTAVFSEQNPTAKFKVGDWVSINGLLAFQITGVRNALYDVTFVNGECRIYDINVFDNEAHLYTIQDANDGDVLVCGVDEKPFIFKGLSDPNHLNCPVAYCGIDPEEHFCVSSGNYWWTDDKDDVRPATKEQRDTLLKAMADAGYTFDFVTKKLEKVEPKFNVGQWIVWQDKCYKVNYNGCGYELIDQNGLSTSSEWTTVDENARIFENVEVVDADKKELKKTEKNAIEPDDLIEESYQQQANDLIDMVEQKSTKLLEENDIDEEYKIGKWFTGLIPCWINAPSTLQPEHSFHGKNVVAIHLKGGGYRCCCVDDKKPIVFNVSENTHFSEGWNNRELSTWGEEDDKSLDSVVNDLKQGVIPDRDDINWLKSLKNRYTWKPSEEQVEALEYFVRSIGESGYASPYDNNTKLLYSLLEQLKKLKE